MKEKGYKPAWVYYSVKKEHDLDNITLTFEDLLLIADLLGYKSYWAKYKLAEIMASERENKHYPIDEQPTLAKNAALTIAKAFGGELVNV